MLPMYWLKLPPRPTNFEEPSQLEGSQHPMFLIAVGNLDFMFIQMTEIQSEEW